MDGDHRHDFVLKINHLFVNVANDCLYVFIDNTHPGTQLSASRVLLSYHGAAASVFLA